jgi:hypothetical protein
MGKKSRPGSGIRIRDEHPYYISESFEKFYGLKILKTEKERKLADGRWGGGDAK